MIVQLTLQLATQLAVQLATQLAVQLAAQLDERRAVQRAVQLRDRNQQFVNACRSADQTSSQLWLRQVRIVNGRRSTLSLIVVKPHLNVSG